MRGGSNSGGKILKKKRKKTPHKGAFYASVILSKKSLSEILNRNWVLPSRLAMIEGILLFYFSAAAGVDDDRHDDFDDGFSPKSYIS